MDRELVRATMNRKLGRFLYSARTQRRESAGQVAASLGISEARLLDIEKKPSEIPCRELYRLFQHYGPEKMHQAQLVMIDAQAVIASGHRRSGYGFNSWKLEFPVFRFPRWAEIFLAVIGGRACADLLKLIASFAIFR
ncbi:MAG: helix-turn-helix domain-containing protein [Bacteriovoracia bacterium]